MRIAHVISSLPSVLDYERVALLLRYVSDEYETELYAPLDCSIFSMLKGSRVKLSPLKISGRHSFFPTDVIRLRAMFKRSRPHAVHTHTSISARVAARICHVPFTVAERYGTGRRSDIGGFYSALYNKFTSLTISHAESVTRRLNLEGVPLDRVFPVSCGVPAVPPFEKNEGKLPLVLADCSGEESLKLFLFAFKRLLTGVRARGALFCPSALLSFARRQISVLGLLDLCEAMPEESIAPEHFPEASVFVYSFSEFGRLPLSALTFAAARVPIIAAATPLNRDFFTEGESGLFFLPGDPFSLCDKLSRVLKDSALRKGLSLGAYEIWQTRHTPKNMLEDYVGIYSAIRRLLAEEENAGLLRKSYSLTRVAERGRKSRN